jgi:uncharacterized protein YjbJ (UPF0337 family)
VPKKEQCPEAIEGTLVERREADTPVLLRMAGWNEAFLSMILIAAFHRTDGSMRRITMAIDTRPTTGTQDETHGSLKEFKGTVKEKVGQLTNNPELENEGTNDKAEGFVEKKVGQVKKVFGS